MRKRTLLLSLLTLCCYLSGNAQGVPSYMPSTGLLAYYSFSGNTVDSTVAAGSSQGTNNGATLTTDRYGTANKAYHFNGTSNYINLGAGLTYTSHTFMCWAKKDNATATGLIPLISRVNDNAFNYKNSELRINAFAVGTGTSFVTVPSPSSPTLTNWNFYVATYDATTNTAKFYVNGVAASSTVSTYGSVNTPTITVGARTFSTSGPSNFFAGSIDEVGIYGRALTQQEITSIYYNQYACATTPTPATVTPNGPTTICPVGSVTLAANSGTAYLWSTGATTQSINVTNAGTYSVFVVGSNGCPAKSSNTAVTVKNMPSNLAIDITGASSVCSPNVIPLVIQTNATNVAGFARQWKNGGVAIPGATNSTYTATATGTYSLTLSGGPNCTANSDVESATIKANPTAAFTINGPTTFCNGDTTMLEANVVTGYTYKWLKNGSISAGISPTLNVATTGSYTLVATLNGCKDTTDVPADITVNLPSEPIMFTGDSTNICAGDSVTLEAAPFATGFSYDWQIGTTSVGTTSDPAFEAKVGGLYKVVLTDTNGCVSSPSVIKIKVTIKPQPTAVITNVGPTTVFMGDSVKLKASPASGVTYQWYRNGNAIVGATDQVYYAFTTGNYRAEVTDDGCKDMSELIAVTISPLTGVEGVAGEGDFGLVGLPNPATGLVSIGIKGLEKIDATLYVMDMQGKLMTEKKTKAATTTLDMTGYAAGVYLVKYKDEDGRTGTIRIVKQ